MTTAEYNDCVRHHADGVYRFVLKQIRDKDTAADIVQDTFEKMWLKHETVEPSKAKSYLFTTAYHTLIDHTRKVKRIVRLEDHMDEPSHQSPHSDLKALLNQGVDKLPDIQKTVILLRDYEGYEYSEIGEITGLSESQVKVYIFRARTFLKKYIGSMEVLI